MRVSSRVELPAPWKLVPMVAMTVLACASTTSTQSGIVSSVSTQSTAASIQPGDMIRVRIWREPDLSGEFMVDETGTVVLPRLGAMSVIGESVGSLRTKVTSAYEQFLAHSSVEVTLTRRLQVLGAVRNPGLYQVDPTMTIEDGLALAGGVTSEGNPDRIELLRHGEKVPFRLSRRTQINDSPIRSGDQLYVPERSWVSRDPGIIIGVLSLATTALVLILRH